MEKLAPKTTWKDLKDLARLWLGETIRRTEEYKCSMIQSQDGANVTIANRHRREVKGILGRVEVYQNIGIGYIPVKGEEHGREIWGKFCGIG